MMRSILLTLILTLMIAGCGRNEPEEPAERFEKPYEDQIKEIEQQQIQHARDQLKAADEQSGGKREDEDGG